MENKLHNKKPLPQLEYDIQTVRCLLESGDLSQMLSEIVCAHAYTQQYDLFQIICNFKLQVGRAVFNSLYSEALQLHYIIFT